MLLRAENETLTVTWNVMSTHNKTFLPTTREAEKISVDQLQSMFPRHSRQALNSALTRAQGDFNLAVTCLLSENEHSNPVAPSHTHPPINTASVQPSVN